MKVLSYGSLNIDYVYKVEHIVTEGETISSAALDVIPGGKGLNQSIALAKAGACVCHAGRVGTEGEFLLDWCRQHGVNTDYVKIDSDTKTGHAIIQVDQKGQNSIVLFGGSNQKQTKEQIDEVLANFEEGDVLLLQNETNLVPYLIEEGHKKGMLVVLNPSPMNEKIFECDLNKVSLFLLNEVEGEQLTGSSDENEICDLLKAKYPKAKFVLTLGSKGAYYFDQDTKVFQEAFKVNVVDTTAAGDTFTGYFIANLMEEETIEVCMSRAAKAAAIAVTRKGASVSIPEKRGVLEWDLL